MGGVERPAGSEDCGGGRESNGEDQGRNKKTGRREG